MKSKGLLGRLAVDSLWAFSGKTWGSVSLVLINVLITRLLSPGEVGVFFIVYSLVSAFSMVGALGLNQAVVRFVAEKLSGGRRDHAAYLGIICLRASVLGGTLSGVTYLLLLPVLRSLVPALGQISLVQFGVGVWIAVASGNLILPQIFRGFHDMAWASLFGLPLANGLYVIALFLLYLFGIEEHINAVIIAGTTATGVSFLIGSITLFCRVSGYRMSCPGFSKSNLRDFSAVCAPIWIASMMFLIGTQADLWIVAATLDTATVALYGAALKLVNIVAFPLLVVNLILQPLIVEYYFAKRTDQLERLLRASATVAGLPVIGVFVSIFFLGGEVLRVIYGSYYEGASLLLCILTFGKLVHVWAGSCGLLLNLTGHQKAAMGLTVASFALSIGGALLLVDPLGAPGVALATSLGLAAFNVACVLYSVQRLRIKPHMMFLGPKAAMSLLRKLSSNRI